MINKLLKCSILSCLILSSVLVNAGDKTILLLEGLTAVDLSGTRITLYDVMEARPIVLVIMASDCPISRRLTPRLKELARIAEEKNIAFYGVFSDAWSTREEILTFQKEYEVDFSLLLDNGAIIAKQLRSGIKPEAFVFNKEGEMAYRGRIDNRFASIGKLRNTFDQHDLLNAIQAVSDNKLPDVRDTQAVGCVYNSWDE